MPPVWGWIFAYLLGFLVFQAIIYWYLQGDGASPDGLASGYTDGERSIRQTVDSPDSRDGGAEPVQCPHCGASNVREPSYTYCRQCTGKLG